MSRSAGKLWILAIIVVVLFCRAGAWQLDRARQKQAMLAESQKVLAERKPLPLSAASDPARKTAYDWTAGEGRFAPAPALLLDNQSRGDRAGIRVYRVFLPATAAPPLLVELGWLPLPGDRKLPVIQAPSGPLHVAGLLAPPPSPGIAGSQATPQADGNLLAIGLDRAEVADALRMPNLAPRVLKLDPALKFGYARDLDILPNTLPPERHVGYAVQWFGLALAVLVIALVLTLRRRRPRRAAAHEKIPDMNPNSTVPARPDPMQPGPTKPDPARVRRGRWILVLIFLLFFGSIFGAGVLRFSGWQPQGTKVHGEMLQPAIDARAVVPRFADGSDYAWRPAERLWRIVVAPAAGCTAECQKLARDLDTVWQLFGNNADHVEILWAGALPADAPDTQSRRVLLPTPELLAALPRVNDPAGVPIYVIDPNGFVILRYAPGTDPGFIRADVSKLLKLI